MLEKLRSIFATAPKTLPQANETLTEARAQIDTLAAELSTRDEKIAALTAELATAEKEGETATAALATVTKARDEFSALVDSHIALFETIGYKDQPGANAADFKTAFAAHVEKQTTLALAKTGHPPAHVPAADTTNVAAKTGKELLAEYRAMPSGKARLDFYTKHEAALLAADRAEHTAAPAA